MFKNAIFILAKLWHWCVHWSIRSYLQWCSSGSWFDIKMKCYQYKNSHCGDKTIFRPSYLHNEFSYTSKMTPLFWITPLRSWYSSLWNFLTLEDGNDLMEITWDGTVHWNFPKVLQTSCVLDVRYFPWDIQACPLHVGPWTYRRSQVM